MSGFMGREFGSKPGAGGVQSSTAANVQRRERLRQLALETVDLSKDPYFMKNHVGSIECKLCLTIHANEGSYLAHTQGKRHQENLGRRNAMLAKETGTAAGAARERAKVQPRKVVKIGRPGYKVIKQRDSETGQRSLLFQIHYPKIDTAIQPRHRFMSAFEQKVENLDGNYQYILFAADPYETISFRIPNTRIDRSEGKFFTHWDSDKQTFTLQLFFEKDSTKLNFKDERPPEEQQQQATA